MSGRERAAYEDDDALIEALANREPVPAGDELAQALAGWTAVLDRDLPPVGPLDPTLMSTVVAGSPARRLVRPVAAAAAVIGLLFGSGAVAVHHAQPGSLFWGVSRVVDPGRATSLEARGQAARSLAVAEEDLAAGHYDLARRWIALARGQLVLVREADGRTALDVRAAVLQRRLDASAAAHQPARPGAPRSAPATAKAGATGSPGLPGTPPPAGMPPKPGSQPAGPETPPTPANSAPTLTATPPAQPKKPKKPKKPKPPKPPKPPKSAR